MPVVYDLESGRRIFANQPIAPRASNSGGLVARRYATGAGGAVAAAAASYAAQKARELFESYTSSSRKSERSKRRMPPRKRKTTRKRKRTSKKNSGRRSRAVVTSRYVKRRRPVPKIRKRDPVGFHGARVTEEQGGIRSDPQLLYIGHTTIKPDLFLKVFWMACIRKLYKEHGVDISDPNQEFAELEISNWVIYVDYYSNPYSTTLLEQPFTVTGISTLSSVANAMVTWVNNPSTPVSPDTVLTKIVLQLPGSQTEALASIDMKSMMMTLKSTSTLAVQNRTQASTGIGDETNANDIAQNPLYGYVYRGKGNGFLPKWRKPGEAGYTSFLGDKDFGLISVNNADSLTEKKKPLPPAFFTRCTRGRRTMLSPATIKKDYISDSWKFPASSFLRKFNISSQPTLVAPIIDRPSYINTRGTAKMFCYEKLLDTRLDEPDVTIGFEINSFVGMSCYYKDRKYMAPLAVVGVSAI